MAVSEAGVGSGRELDDAFLAEDADRGGGTVED